MAALLAMLKGRKIDPKLMEDSESDEDSKSSKKPGNSSTSKAAELLVQAIEDKDYNAVARAVILIANQ